MTGLRLALAAGTLSLVTAASADAQDAAQPAAGAFGLSVADIMRGPEHVGSSPAQVRWTDDGEWVYFQWLPGGEAWTESAEQYRVPADGGPPDRVPDEEADSVGVLLAQGDLSPDRTLRVVSYRGDLYLIDRASLETRRLTETRGAATSPIFSRDGQTIYFLYENNVFSLSVERGLLRQLTDVRTGPPEEPREAEGHRRFLEEQQLELFETLRRQAEQREREEAEREERDAAQPETIHIQERERVSGLAVEPDGRFVVLEVTTPAQDQRQTIVPDYVTESGFTENLDVRAKVGDAQSEGRIGLVRVATGQVEWLDLAEAAGSDDERPTVNTRFVGWNDDGTRGLIVASSYDFKSRWLFVIDAETADLALVARDHDEAWLAGPCGFCIGWMPDGETIYFASERDGFAHLYTVGADGEGLHQLTSGEWEVHSVGFSADDDRFYLRTNEGSPFEFHFYHMDLDGRNRTRITEPSGRHEASPSPDGSRLAVVYSYSNQPPELFLMENRPGAEMQQITTTPTADWRSFGWLDPEIVHFEARDGVRVPARIYRPRDMGAEPHGGAVIFVHGAGYLQNVHRGWSSYYREYMFHHLLASRGFVVLDIDFRASAGYGRDWRTAIYRHMGGKDLTDQVDGARYLVAHEGVDPQRIGIYGGSYGGFITLMALFTEAETFAAGAALRAVTDWAHYNHTYTGRILNLPHDDDDAYRRSSPIYFAEGLQAPLLISHGMVDTNVHFQDVVRLAQRLIELGKTDWEMAIYPKENHAYVDPASWTDQYRRILRLFEQHLTPAVTAEDR